MQGLGVFRGIKGDQQRAEMQKEQLASQQRQQEWQTEQQTRQRKQWTQEDADRAFKNTVNLSSQLKDLQPDRQIPIVKQYIQKQEEQGNDPQFTRNLLAQLESGDPNLVNDAQNAINTRYRQGVETKLIAPQEQKGEWKILSNEDKLKLGITMEGQFQMSPDGKVQKLGGKGQQISVNVGGAGKFGTIPPGYALNIDPKTGLYKMYEIPGGPASKKSQEDRKKDIMQVDKVKQDADIVLKATRKLLGKLKNESVFNPITGPLGQIAENFRGSEAADAEGLRNTIGAGVAFKSLQDMRASNKTGGGLGAISEKEMELLKASMGSFNKEMSREAQIEALQDLDRIYSGILKKARAYPEAEQFGFGAAKPMNVNGQEMPEEVRSRYY
jgi:hypothetical protein